MVNPKILCRKHLLGEHVETHMFVGSIKKDHKMDGYITGGLLDVGKLSSRHDELAKEMIDRGYKHNSPIDQLGKKLITSDRKINIEENLKDLRNRCGECKRLQEHSLCEEVK